jgi:hypothetical protein
MGMTDDTATEARDFTAPWLTHPQLSIVNSQLTPIPFFPFSAFHSLANGDLCRSMANASSILNPQFSINPIPFFPFSAFILADGDLCRSMANAILNSQSSILN